MVRLKRARGGRPRCPVSCAHALVVSGFSRTMPGAAGVDPPDSALINRY